MKKKIIQQINQNLDIEKNKEIGDKIRLLFSDNLKVEDWNHLICHLNKPINSTHNLFSSLDLSPIFQNLPFSSDHELIYRIYNSKKPNRPIYLKDTFSILSGEEFIDIFLSMVYYINHYLKSPILIRELGKELVPISDLKCKDSINKAIFYNLKLDTKLENIKFNNCVFIYVTFQKEIKNVEFNNCIIYHCQFLKDEDSDIFFDGILISKCYLENIEFSRSYFRNCVIENCKEVDCSSKLVYSIIISKSYLEKCKIIENTIKAEILNSILIDIKLSNNLLRSRSNINSNHFGRSKLDNIKDIDEFSNNYLNNCDETDIEIERYIRNMIPYLYSHHMPSRIYYYNDNNITSFSNEDIMEIYLPYALYCRIKKYTKEDIETGDLYDPRKAIEFNDDYIKNMLDKYFYSKGKKTKG